MQTRFLVVSQPGNAAVAFMRWLSSVLVIAARRVTLALFRRALGIGVAFLCVCVLAWLYLATPLAWPNELLAGQLLPASCMLVSLCVLLERMICMQRELRESGYCFGDVGTARAPGGAEHRARYGPFRSELHGQTALTGCVEAPNASAHE